MTEMLLDISFSFIFRLFFPNVVTFEATSADSILPSLSPGPVDISDVSKKTMDMLPLTLLLARRSCCHGSDFYCSI